MFAFPYPIFHKRSRKLSLVSVLSLLEGSCIIQETLHKLVVRSAVPSYLEIAAIITALRKSQKITCIATAITLTHHLDLQLLCCLSVKHSIARQRGFSTARILPPLSPASTSKRTASALVLEASFTISKYDDYNITENISNLGPQYPRVDHALHPDNSITPRTRLKPLVQRTRTQQNV